MDNPTEHAGSFRFIVEGKKQTSMRQCFVYKLGRQMVGKSQPGTRQSDTYLYKSNNISALNERVHRSVTSFHLEDILLRALTDDK